MKTQIAFTIPGYKNTQLKTHQIPAVAFMLIFWTPSAHSVPGQHGHSRTHRAWHWSRGAR